MNEISSETWHVPPRGSCEHSPTKPLTLDEKWQELGGNPPGAHRLGHHGYKMGRMHRNRTPFWEKQVQYVVAKLTKTHACVNFLFGYIQDLLRLTPHGLSGSDSQNHVEGKDMRPYMKSRDSKNRNVNITGL